MISLLMVRLLQECLQIFLEVQECKSAYHAGSVSSLDSHRNWLDIGSPGGFFIFLVALAHSVAPSALPGEDLAELSPPALVVGSSAPTIACIP